MSVYEPDELWSDLNQQDYSSMLQEELEQLELDQPDPENVSTPEEASDGSKWAPLTDNPTSTSNVEQPRTLAAGYDKKNFILTIQFRDGTLYNYYDVPPSLWREFRLADSKGKYMQGELDNWSNKGEVSGHSQNYYSKKAKQSRKAQAGKYATIDQIIGRNK